jgi:hypothetical protein
MDCREQKHHKEKENGAKRHASTSSHAFYLTWSRVAAAVKNSRNTVEQSIRGKGRLVPRRTRHEAD